ncbi:unnamed protein product [Periconia digitata]|uniref:Major facilitator superfamily (MFS) profile domain-containing protein n=1 Tax=Periconia digitata TaxID=1303443 RepID=A0A9W4ULF2_9PLEO|nr:unnamed protein product [Periconia digitata]
MPSTEPTDQRKTRGWRFWMAILSLNLIGFVATLEGTVLGTALPRITQEIRTSGSMDYVWMADTFALAQTVVQPPLSQICNIFGRRTPMMASVALFALGSGIAGGANNSTMFIAGRTIQGIGSGGILLMVELIVCDLVPLRERGKYLGIVLSSSAVGAVVGPVIAGALVEADWRWIFYLNLPICALVILMMRFSVRLRHQNNATWKASLARVDWIGSSLFIASLCSLLVGLIFGGSDEKFAWSSWRVILPIVLGIVGWIAFHIYEVSGSCKEPSVPSILFSNRTSIVGFFLVFDASILMQWVAFFLPIYFQGVRKVSPLKSGINFLPFQVFLIPAASITGAILSKTGKYKPLHLTGFILCTLGLGLLTLLNDDTPTVQWVVFEAIEAMGQALLIPTILPAIQASLSESEVASSVGLYSFLRSFGWFWGITIPSIIFNNRWGQLEGRISNLDVRASLSGGQAYHSTGTHPSWSSTTLAEVVSVYTDTLRTLWYAAIAIAGIGFLAVFCEKSLALRETLETEYGLEQEKQVNTEEHGVNVKN